MKNHILRSASAATLILSISAGFATTASAQDSYSDEIIVTGSPLIRSVDEAITGVSVLTGEELSQRLAGTIGETLKSEPGVSSTFSKKTKITMTMIMMKNTMMITKKKVMTRKRKLLAALKTLKPKRVP